MSTLRSGDTFGWAAKIADPREYLLEVNAQIARALPADAPRTVWVLPADIVKIAARNPGYLQDPYGTDAAQFAPDRWRAGSKLTDPLASDLRTYTSFVDARVVLVPVELRFFPRPIPIDRTPVERAAARQDSLAGMGRAVMRIALVDTRSMTVFWVSDVVGDAAPTLTPAVMTNLADRMAQALARQ